MRRFHVIKSKPNLCQRNFYTLATPWRSFATFHLRNCGLVFSLILLFPYIISIKSSLNSILFSCWWGFWTKVIVQAEKILWMWWKQMLLNFWQLTKKSVSKLNKSAILFKILQGPKKILQGPLLGPGRKFEELCFKP